MCGIFGYAGSRVLCPPKEVEQALSLLRHRGPDASGFVRGNGWGLGACRLAILDLVAGDQPVKNENGTVHAVLNGELYNYLELREGLRADGHRIRSSGDTELLVHLWEEHGRGLVSHLRGMFAFAVADTRTQKLFLARDRLGKKPLYWMRSRGGLFFASELKALRPFASTWTVDPRALGEFLTFGFVPEGSCFVHGVEKLPPGHWLELDIPTGEIRVGCYERFEFAPDLLLDEEEAAQRLMGVLGEATALRLRADVPVAVFLSGGLDSATVAALARRLGEAPKLLFVDLGDGGERRRAATTAGSLGLELEVLPGEQAPGPELFPRLAEVFDEPLADPSVVPTFFVAKAASGKVKVVLNGDGGDELLAGYRRFLLTAAASHPVTRWAVGIGLAAVGGLLNRPWWARRFAAGLDDPTGGYLAWGPVKFTPGEVAEMVGYEPELESFRQILDRAPTDSAINRLRALELFFFLPGDLLVKMDRATMAWSLEARSPFLDQEVVRFLLTVPPTLLLQGFRTKSLLRRATRGLVPAAVRRAPKRGFEPPLSAWLAGPWSGEVARVLRDPRSGLRSFVRISGVEKNLRKLSVSDPARHARAVFTLLTLEHWLARWG